jgi:hypothetical protein
MAGPSVAAEAAPAEAALAMVSAPARAVMVSWFRFRVMIRRARDKVTLQLVARGRARRAARLPSPWVPAAWWGGRAIVRGGGTGQGTGRVGGHPRAGR